MLDIVLPDQIRPVDGRFGSGPSKVRQEAVESLARVAPGLLGTSHRQAPVKAQVGRLREGLRVFFGLPEGYEVALGNGGATLFWDAAAFGLIRERSAHAVFGEFSSKFAAVTRAAPFLADPLVTESPFGTHPDLHADPTADLYALTHNETSTGVVMPVTRPDGISAEQGLVAVDATSAAGALTFDPADCDAYYFAPQKAFASDGGLWIALLSPASMRRLDEIAASGRHIPTMLDIRLALENSRKDQTYNTPAVATLYLMAEQVDWMNAHGGLAWAAKDCAAKAGHLYDWAASRDWASPFVADPAQRSNVVCTIDLDESVRADEVVKVLRANGVVDIDAYRKLGRNQLRIAVFPAVEAGDVERLTAALDYVVDALRSAAG
ncbi:MAG: phosphoserine transaminase [Nitriliruptorales bacterium]|nr:phosphoserine transaminase [Nitriliruptorales bacterium]